MYFQVIMPIGSDPQKEEKEETLRRVAARRDASPHFPRYASQDPVFNLQSSLQSLRRAEFVVADLSHERPSCYYELGLAEALGKPVYLLAEEGTDIHQTTARRFVRFFRGLEGFRDAIEEILDEALGRKEAASQVGEADN